MPVRRRKSKARAAGIDAWDPPLALGFDVIHTLSTAGVRVNPDLRFDLDEARAAWRLYGVELLERWRERWGADEAATSWAMEEFGQPQGSSRAG